LGRGIPTVSQRDGTARSTLRLLNDRADDNPRFRVRGLQYVTPHVSR
jgi:hypothetical protein